MYDWEVLCSDDTIRNGIYLMEGHLSDGGTSDGGTFPFNIQKTSVLYLCSLSHFVKAVPWTITLVARKNSIAISSIDSTQLSKI